MRSQTQQRSDTRRAPPNMLRTRRLLLRLVGETDAEGTAPLVGPDVAANLSTWPSPMSTQQVLERVHEAQALLAAGDAINWAILRRSDERLMGWIGLRRTARGEARVGYWLGAPFRGRGLMKEAVAAAVPAGSEFLTASLVIAHVLPNNLPSIAVLQRCGFRRVGEEPIYRETAGRSDLCLRFEWVRTEHD